MQWANAIVACQQPEEIGHSLALDDLMEAERQQALEAVKRDEELRRTGVPSRCKHCRSSWQRGLLHMQICRLV